jgi:hypothetical protein
MRRTSYAALAALALTACGDPAGSSGNQQGSLRFDYTGAATGSYQAEAPAQDTAGTAPYALARPLPLGLELVSRPGQGTTAASRVRFAINQKGTGRYPFRTMCDMLSTARCAFGRVELSNPATGARATYFLIAGELVVTSAGAGRVRGTFSGTAQLSLAREIQLQNGEFDVPVLAP